MVPLYSIRDWGQHETPYTKKLKGPLQYVGLPTKLDGTGYRCLISQADGMALFGAWVLIVEIAAKCHPRGTLQDSQGTPLTAETLALKTGGNAMLFQRALELLASPGVGWLSADLTKSDKMLSDFSQSGTPSYSYSYSNSAQEKIQTKKKTLLEEAAEVSLPEGWSENDQTRQAIAEWLEYKQQRGERYKSSVQVGKMLATFVKEWGQAGQGKFLEAVSYSIGMNYQGCFAPRANGYGNGNGCHRGLADQSGGQKYDPERKLKW